MTERIVAETNEEQTRRRGEKAREEEKTGRAAWLSGLGGDIAAGMSFSLGLLCRTLTAMRDY